MKIAVFFPGIGYHCDKPLLYYSRKIAIQLGYDKVVTLSYSYDGGDVFNNKEKMKEAFEVLYKQAENALQDIAFEEYEEVLFVSKSVGTIIASQYAAGKNINCKHILYTPLEYTFGYPHQDAIAFIGTADLWSNVDDVIGLAKKQNVQIFSYEGLNHSLEKDDVQENLHVLVDVMDKTAEYLESKYE